MYSGDHAGAIIPHVHAHFDEGDVAIELYADRTDGLSSAHTNPIDPFVKRKDVRRALEIAADEIDELLELWEASRTR